MKKLFILMMGILVAVICNQNSRKNKDDDAADAELTTKLTTKKQTYSYEEDKIGVSIEVDYPNGGSEILKDALSEFINETLGGSYEGELDEGRTVVDFYGGQIKTELINEKAEQSQDLDEDAINAFYKHITIKKDYETDLLVTYLVDQDIYLNGAHGMQYHYGQTFRKSDGRRFGPDMMMNVGSEGMYSLIKEGLRSYFAENSTQPIDDEELKTYIISEDDVDYLPMPHHTPYVTQKGVVFTYQPYEISFYAAGMPEFAVTLNDMKPYLSVTAKRMLGLSDPSDDDDDDDDDVYDDDDDDMDDEDMDDED